jgi:ADP-ribose pyrophosphatase YjhB (NUDIX family)
MKDLFMAASTSSRWLDWAREIQALSQTGLTFCQNDYDRERLQRLLEIAAEIVGCHTELDKESVQKNFLAQPGYATPKVDVRGAVIRDGKILLVQERTDECWCMPGGWADIGEMPSEMIVREVFEESGFQVAPRKIIGVYDANRTGRPMEFYHAYKIVFLCDIMSGEPRPSYETLAVDFFSFDRLPPLSLNRTNERHLADVLAHSKDQSRATAFD